jgi:hypothetical protein
MIKMKGFTTTIEAIIALIFLSSIIILSQNFNESKPLNEVLIIQKGHDLIKVWVIGGEKSLNEMVKDFKQAFPNLAGEIIIDNSIKRIEKTGIKTKNLIVLKGFYLNEKNELKKIILKIFY